MSLLMDALKKAEKEKKDAAIKLKEREEKSTSELSFEEQQPVILTESTDKKDDSTKKETQQTDIPESSSGNTITTELSLDAVEESEADTVIKAQSSDNKLELNEPEKDEPSTSEEITLETETVNPDQTFATTNLSLENGQPAEGFIDTVKFDITDEFSDTVSGTIGDSKTAAAIVSAAELAKDIGDSKNQPTPVAAQTVFTAIGASSSRQPYSWAIFVVLCIVISISLSVFYYLSITPLTPGSSSPLVAKGIETESNPLPVIEIPQEILASGIIDSLAPAEQQFQDVDEIVTTEITEATTEQPSEIISEPGTEIKGVETDFITESISGTGVLPDKIEVEPTLIKISRSKSKDTQGELINSAYAEYIAGNYKLAEASYQKVLTETPDNRDALLGLATITYQKGDLQSAFEGYIKVLKLYPKDSIAQTALINMQKNNDPVRSESIIKLLLQQEPEAPFLYFTLGNLYATQSRWADAQQAFFNAYRLATSNPDYAYNLAVSLDHIGQTSTALDYYNVALGLADDSRVNFNTVTVIARIDALSDITRSN